MQPDLAAIREEIAQQLMQFLPSIKSVVLESENIDREAMIERMQAINESHEVEAVVADRPEIGSTVVS